jgi:Flp pilus assembly protein TadG
MPIMRRVDPKMRSRRAAAAVELAIMLPLLMLIMMISCDFARLYYHYLTITNCARNGALWACDPTTSAFSQYSTVQQAALADAPNLTPTPTVTSTSGTDADGHTNVSVTVKYTFSLISSYLGFSKVTLSRTVEMRVAPAAPN